MKKLYRVDVAVELVVAAESAEEAESEAEYRLVDVEDGGADVNARATPLTPRMTLPAGWDTDTIPFCSEGDKTIGEYLCTTATAVPST